MTKKDKKFTWDQRKLDIAKEMSSGIKTQEQIAKDFNITNVTISRWKAYPEFMAKVDEFTLLHENATKAGLLRQAYKGLNIKEKNIQNDKSTHLDYTKFICDVEGHAKPQLQKVEHSGGVKIELQMKDCSKKESSV